MSATGSAPAAQRHHAIDYVELTVTDLDRSKRFFADAFGWAFTDHGPDYAGFRDARRGPEESGGLRRDEAVAAGGGPLVLLFSADLDQTLAAVTSAGGRVAAGPYGFPGGRRFEFLDPSGNRLGVWSES